MPTIARTDSSDPDFALLVAELDAELRDRYAELQDGYDKLNKLPAGAKVVLAYEGGESLGCACLKETGEAGTVELKRMFVRGSARGRGVSKALLAELEAWARESGARRMILETGAKQPEAIGLYEAMGFARIENYGEYHGKGNSVCMAKALGT